MSDLPVGATIQDTYRVEQIIARGGMGEVYRAINVHTHDTVAIKVVRPDMLDDQLVRELFRREAMALRTVRHPAIVAFEGILGDSQGRLYLVMDYVDGPSLASVMRDRRLSVEEVRRLGGLLSDGLAAAHKQGVVHRDLAPDNIVLRGGELDKAVIIDFGIAKRIDGKASTLIGSAFAGKLDYCSPEQCGLFGGRVDHRTDIYSLGLTLAAAAIGAPIPMGSSMAHAVQARMNLPNLSKLPATLQRDLAPMLQPDPAARLQDIRGAFAASPTRLEASSAPTRRIARAERSWLSARRGWVAASAAGLMLLSVGAILVVTYEPATQAVTDDSAERGRLVREVAARRAEEERRQAAEKAETDRLAREAAAKAERERLARDEAARRGDEERRQAAAKEERERLVRDEAARQAEEERRQAAEKTERERSARIEEARRQAIEKADREAREKAEREAAAQRAEEEEAGLHLTERDRRRLQVALSSLGFDTQGADGVLGRRSRQMIQRWQEREGHPPTGFVTAAQRDNIFKAADAALAKWEADQARAAEQARQVRDRASPPPSGRSFGERFNNPE